jgi:histidyl-tRNA synthetase
MAKKTAARTAKGFRDFLPADMLKRQYVIDTITRVFERYGFEPLQTPVLELHDTLYGKMGEDAENLIFDAQHSRSKSDPLAMRYDLTVPLARVVAEHESVIQMPFKRYHIAPVWRGERPQRGRYREFFQCDADIVGVANMSADAELINLTIQAILALGFDNFKTRINSRKLLLAMGEYSGVPDAQLPDLYRSVDKYDKVGAEGVRKELVERGIADDVVGRMMDLVQFKGDTPSAVLDHIDNLMGDIESAREAIAELRDLAKFLDALDTPREYYDLDFTVVRGLGYYTGPIWETIFDDGSIGSINGGGRYDELIGIFRKQSLPTSGTSLGIERIIDLMDDLDLYPPHIGGTVVQVLVTVFSDETQPASMKLANTLRKAGIRTEVYMSDSKFKLGKQFNYADKKNIPITVVMAPDEIEAGVVNIKRLKDGQETQVAYEASADTILKMLGE